MDGEERITLIAHTGLDRPHEHKKAIAAGFDDVVLKGASFDELVASMLRCMSKRYEIVSAPTERKHHTDPDAEADTYVPTLYSVFGGNCDDT